MIEERGVDQLVVEDDVRGRQQLRAAQGEQARVPGAAADEINDAGTSAEGGEVVFVHERSFSGWS